MTCESVCRPHEQWNEDIDTCEDRESSDEQCRSHEEWNSAEGTCEDRESSDEQCRPHEKWDSSEGTCEDRESGDEPPMGDASTPYCGVDHYWDSWTNQCESMQAPMGDASMPPMPPMDDSHNCPPGEVWSDAVFTCEPYCGVDHYWDSMTNQCESSMQAPMGDASMINLAQQDAKKAKSVKAKVAKAKAAAAKALAQQDDAKKAKATKKAKAAKAAKAKAAAKAL